MTILARAAFAAALLATSALAQNVPAPRADAQQPAAEKVEVEGFRSARWGMTEAEVKAAIRKDFNAAADKVKVERHPTERTTVLTVRVEDLLEGAGPAQVAYVLGYTSKKLVQVNIVWGTPVDPTPAEHVVAAANQLRQFFLNAGYDPETVVGNAKASDGTIVVFQGQDARKRTTVLRLASVSPAEKAEKAEPAVTLFLSYVLDSRNPDIFRLRKGQF